MTNDKKLARPLDDRWIAGVCSGIARYLGWDPTAVRIAWVLLICCVGMSLLVYPILWLVMPNDE